MTKFEIKVPAMGESITEATVGNIIKPSGSSVKMDDEILELETDKVNQVLYAGQAGKLSLTVKPDEVVKIGQVIGTIEGNGAGREPPPKEEEEPKKEKPAEEEKEEAAPKTEKKEAPTEQKPAPAQGGIRQSKEDYVSELHEKKPAEKKPSPESVKTTEKGERNETRRRMTKIRKVIAKRLVEAKAATAMLTTFNEVDLTEVMKLRSKYKDPFAKQHGAKLGLCRFLSKPPLRH